VVDGYNTKCITRLHTPDFGENLYVLTCVMHQMVIHLRWNLPIIVDTMWLQLVRVGSHWHGSEVNSMFMVVLKSLAISPPSLMLVIVRLTKVIDDC